MKWHTQTAHTLSKHTHTLIEPYTVAHMYVYSHVPSDTHTHIYYLVGIEPIVRMEKISKRHSDSVFERFESYRASQSLSVFNNNRNICFTKILFHEDTHKMFFGSCNDHVFVCFSQSFLRIKTCEGFNSIHFPQMFQLPCFNVCNIRGSWLSFRRWHARFWDLREDTRRMLRSCATSRKRMNFVAFAPVPLTNEELVRVDHKIFTWRQYIKWLIQVCLSVASVGSLNTRHLLFLL